MKIRRNSFGDSIYNYRLPHYWRRYWSTDKNKAPLGSCTIKLPEPNLQLVDVELELGYTAVISDTVGSVHPMPPIKKYKFSLNSAARKV